MMRPYLVPLDVPWMVSPSVSGLRVCTWENDDTTVAFNALIPDGVEARGDAVDTNDPRVVMTFESGQWVSFSPGASDQSSVDFSTYDLSRLPLAGLATPEPYLSELDAMWRRDQKCPNPGVFEVDGSEWVIRTGAQRYGHRHYIVAGHDAAVEVLAKGFSWRYVDRGEDECMPRLRDD